MESRGQVGERIFNEGLGSNEENSWNENQQREKRLLKISQAEYVKKVLKRFNMSDAKPVNVPLGGYFKLSKAQAPTTEDEKALMSEVPHASIVGSLMYAMICTRPDIAQAVRVISRYMSNPEKEHWRVVKWILRYLKGSSDMTLCYDGPDVYLHNYVDSGFVGNVDNRKSTTGYVFILGSGAVSWVSRL